MDHAFCKTFDGYKVSELSYKIAKNLNTKNPKPADSGVVNPRDMVVQQSINSQGIQKNHLLKKMSQVTNSVIKLYFLWSWLGVTDLQEQLYM